MLNWEKSFGRPVRTCGVFPSLEEKTKIKRRSTGTPQKEFQTSEQDPFVSEKHRNMAPAKSSPTALRLIERRMRKTN